MKVLALVLMGTLSVSAPAVVLDRATPATLDDPEPLPALDICNLIPYYSTGVCDPARYCNSTQDPLNGRSCDPPPVTPPSNDSCQCS